MCILLLLSSKYSLYILTPIPYYMYMIRKYCLPIYGVYCHSLDGIIFSSKFLVWIELIYLFFATCAFDVISQKPLHNPRLWRSTPLFFSKNYFTDWVLNLGLLSILVNFCIWYEGERGPLHLFSCGYPVVPGLFVEKASFAPFSFLDICRWPIP